MGGFFCYSQGVAIGRLFLSLADPAASRPRHPVFYRYVLTSRSIYGPLWDFYLRAAPIPNDEISLIHQQLSEKLSPLPFLDSDAILSLASRLSTEYERMAFQAGVRIGAAIVLELFQI